ncbi:hypothetical protein [Altibacter lentus]|uniref:hypothetical protein n=1 Tax=Altibacter lentus TaxID=1223410 RepID=UPI000555BB5F|nr:hypothetical protein [Altibacter lentus]
MKTKITLLALCSLVLLSCQKEDTLPVNDSSNLIIEIGDGTVPDPTSSIYTTDLMAGQNMYAGTVNVEYIDGTIVVTYASEGDWGIDETHLFVGDLSNLPVNGGGNPKIGKFPYKGTHPAGTTTVTVITIPAASGECVTVAAHAVVTNAATGQSETAWGDGESIGGNNWSMMFEVCIP